MAAVLCDLIPAEPDEAFVAVDVGAGDAWLSEAVLRRFPRAHVIALDGSLAMRDAARRRLAAFGARAKVRPFELGSLEWLQELRGPVRCFLSCLVVHHLDDAAKRRLFAALRRRLEPGGAMLIADIVRPASRWGWRHAARMWEEDVRRRSLQLTGNLEAYQRLAGSDWNWFDHPDDPMDKPATSTSSPG
ncbi:MAG: methyltransferase domain-containing protein [Bacillota bacterium]